MAKLATPDSAEELEGRLAQAAGAAAGAGSTRPAARGPRKRAEKSAAGAGPAGRKRDANNEAGGEEDAAAETLGALMPMTRLKPRGGLSSLPLAWRIQRAGVLGEDFERKT